MDLAPGIADFIARSNEHLPPHYMSLPLAEQRACYRALCQAFERPRPAGIAVEDRNLALPGRDIAIRIYRPQQAKSQSPCILYMHGGGWVLGDLDSHDSVTADLAATAGAVVVAVDYRLAPEHPYPAAVDDCWEVLLRLLRDAPSFGIDPARILVAGDSAGGGLSAVLCLKARAAGGPCLAGQVLIYPGLGRGWDGKGKPAEDAPLLSGEEMLYYTNIYLGGATSTQDPYAAPLLAETFAGLPAAYIMAIKYDPLCADALLYAERLGRDGVPVELDVVPGLVHGCLRARDLSPVAADAFDRVCAAARRLLAAQPAQMSAVR